MNGGYTAGLANLPLPLDDERRLFIFLGAGNFESAQADTFLAEIVALMAPGDALSIGPGPGQGHCRARSRVR